MRLVEASAFPHMDVKGRKGILRSLKNAVGRRRGSNGSQQRNSTPEDFAALGIPVVYVNADGSERK